MQILWDYDSETLMVVPTIVISAVKCGGCEEDHGFSVSFCWLFWSLVVFFPGAHE